MLECSQHWCSLFFVLSANQCNVPIIMLTKAIHDYIQRTFDEHKLMAGKIPGEILNLFNHLYKSLFDHIYLSVSLTTILTLYAEMVLHQRRQKSYLILKETCVIDLNQHTSSCGKWCSLGIACAHAITSSRHSNIHELPDMVQIYYIYYRDDVFQTAYQTQTVHNLLPPSE
uniref:SWIM-type domain-containing protein n=1 Tax=Lactuca sativa TaxID=4236 RepID=A0A9R1XT35_LACSA|nr:hypothetical protein LSAT_V11C200064840 [Lactuca sativa]